MNMDAKLIQMRFFIYVLYWYLFSYNITQCLEVAEIVIGKKM